MSVAQSLIYQSSGNDGLTVNLAPASLWRHRGGEGQTSATAPDWLEWVSGAVLRRKIKHRTVTHVLTTWLTAALFFGLVWDYRSWGLAFALGGLCHWLQDSLTVTGVPVSWWSDRRKTLLGGRMRTGCIGEYSSAPQWSRSAPASFSCAG